METFPCKLSGLSLIKPTVFKDDRGFFVERYRESSYSKLPHFVQDNLSFSKEGVIRGMHFQKDGRQGKLVSVIKGKIFDVAVDVRPNSPTFGKWEGVILDGEEQLQFFIPGGFAHGFCALTDAFVYYKVTTYFDVDKEHSFLWSDPQVGINWPKKEPILSLKDKMALLLKDIKKELL
jgi:dTDP-4-dehydrorhamnose 3,5-epimerase